MEKIINKLINEFVKGVDIYKTDGGSTWLIFTDTKQWVIELNEHKTLWYNYNFFKNIFNYASMDVVENQHYITKWVEDNIINGVNYTTWGPEMKALFVDGVLEKGINETKSYDLNNDFHTNEVIKTGVKEIKYNQSFQEPKFKEVLKNGIIMSNPRQYVTNKILDDTIENGVKKTQGTPNWTHNQKVSNVIDNGVKETHDDAYHHKDRIDGVIKNGVMETELHKGNRRFATNYAIKRGVKETHREIREYKNTIDYIIQTGVKETKACYYKDPKTNLMFIKWDYQINNIIETGIKEVQPLPSQEGNKDWGNYYHDKKNRVKPFIEYLNEAIMFGVKETRVDASQNPMGKVNQVIENGIKKPTD
jgi:subtilisin family serine protease